MKIFIAFLFSFSLLFAAKSDSAKSDSAQNSGAVPNTSSSTAAQIDNNESNESAKAAKLALIQRSIQLKERIEEIGNKIEANNIWVKKYSNFRTYERLELELTDVETELFKLEDKKRQTKKDKARIEELREQANTLKRQMSLLDEYKKEPFKSLIQPQEIPEIPSVNNPIAIINAFSFIKQMEQQRNHFKTNFRHLKSLVQELEEKERLLQQLIEIKEESLYVKELQETSKMLDELAEVQTIFTLTLDVYNKKVDEIILNVSEGIKQEGKKSLYIVAIILVLFLIALFIKLISKKYISDNERLYTVNKIINFINVTLIILILLFSYLENVNYLVTVLGFASAGLAIAMKDLFMSLLGWLVIVLGGSIHVGDRIKVKKDGVEYVGDVLDISLLRITMHEDVTLTSYMVNRRAGRVIFVPNNYVFTTLISNYTHSSMKTVWDGIDITVTFDSNFKKALHISRDITKRYAKGYTDITRKQLNKLRDKYSLRNASVEPRVFHFIEPNGVRLSIWYQTNSYATLTLRSTISGEIISQFNECDDITIAYPTQRIVSDSPRPIAPMIENEAPAGNPLS